VGAWLLGGVGFMSNIKNKTVLKFHMVGAIFGFLLILLGFWIDYSMFYITIIAFILMLLTTIKFFKKPYLTWLIELVAIVNMLVGYFILLN
jgi:hypothetical protein